MKKNLRLPYGRRLGGDEHTTPLEDRTRSAILAFGDFSEEHRKNYPIEVTEEYTETQKKWGLIDQLSGLAIPPFLLMFPKIPHCISLGWERVGHLPCSQIFPALAADA